MPEFITEAQVNRHILPMLHLAVKNVEDNFTQLMGRVNAGARTALGVDVNMLVNDWQMTSGFNEDQELGAAIKVADKKTFIPWINWTTPLLRIPESDVRTLTYPKESAVRSELAKTVKSHQVATALHNLAPTADGVNTPVVQGTGDDRGDGTKAITKADILKLRERYEGMDYVLVLCKQHLIDLLADEATSQTDKQVLSNLMQGTIGVAYGIRITVNERIKSKYLANGTKKALDAAPLAGDKNASIMIERMNSLFDNHTILAQYKPVNDDTKYSVPQSRIRFYGQFMGSVIHDDKERAALIDGTTA